MADEQVVYPKDVLTRVQEWPKQITCHSNDWLARRHQPEGIYEWRRLDGHDWCQYCGSCSVHNLLAYLDGGATLGGADWKHGWPHKFYIYGKDVPHGMVKFKNEHLMELDDQTFAEVASILERGAGIRFEREVNDKGVLSLFYSAPYAGYQR